MRLVLTDLGGRHSPHLEVVGSHEEICDTSTHHTDNPLVKVLGLGAGDSGLEGSLDHAIHALDLLLLWQHGNVILERIWDPEVLATNVGDSLMGVPIRLVWEGLVDAVIEVLVVGEDNMAADIVKL